MDFDASDTATKLLESAQKAFGKKGFPALKVFAFGDFTQEEWEKGANALLCKDPGSYWGCRRLTREDHILWDWSRQTWISWRLASRTTRMSKIRSLNKAYFSEKHRVITSEGDSR